MSVGLNIKNKMKEKGITVMNAVEFLKDSGVIAKKSGEPYKISSLYALLNGTREMEASLVPYFSELLDTPEQDFFDISKREKIATEEILDNIEKYSQKMISFSIRGISQDLTDFLGDFLLLDEKDQEMYVAEIKAKALRKKSLDIE